MASLHAIFPTVCRTCIAIALAATWLGSPALAENAGGNRSELVRSLLPSVVNITVRKQIAPTGGSLVAAADGKTYVGSGFVIDPSGLIVTNYHVVEDAFEITVTFSDGSIAPGKFLHASRLADIAIVQVQPDHPLTPAQWGDSTKLRIGDEVLAIGNPLGIGMSVSAGIVSGLDRNVQDSPYDDYIQTDAAINHGNSGGPLFDMTGRVVGVNTALVSPTEASAGLGLAIPADNASFVINRLMTYGWVHPGWMGVKVQEVTSEMAEALGLPRAEGSVVSWVFPQGPAKQAGLAIGDVILRYGLDAPQDERALLRDIVRTPVGDTVPVVVLRGGKQVTLPVTVAVWPRSRWDELDAPSVLNRPALTIPPDLGLSLSASPADELAKLGVEDGWTGVLVSGVLAGSDAARRGITVGDVILRVQDQPVAVPKDVQQAIDAERAQKHRFTMMLVLQKERRAPGPSWVTLRLPDSTQ